MDCSFVLQKLPACISSGNGPGIAQNSDISGLGVRAAFYVQTFILVLLVDRSVEDALGSLWTLIALSFGLTVAALSALSPKSQQQLNLLQAIIVSQLTWLANFGTFIALASYSRSPRKEKNNTVVKICAVLQTVFSMVSTIVLWARASSFPDPCKSITSFVTLFGKHSAVESGRWIGLGFSIVLTVIYVVMCCRELESWDRERRRRRKDTYHHGGRHPSDMPIASAEEQHPRGLFLQQISKMTTGVVIVEILIFAYFIATTELLLSSRVNCLYNGGNPWQFGQILALVLIFPSLISLVTNVWNNGLRYSKIDEEEHGDTDLT